MKRKVRWGIIGCGGIAARRVIPEFNEFVSSAELISVMATTIVNAKRIADQFGIQHYCATEQELLAQDIDAVYIATPPNMHCAQTVRAAAAGKNVLCEKPMTLSLDEADLMESACVEAGVKFMLAFCMRHNVYNNKIRELIEHGALGQLVMGRAQLSCWFPPIAGAWRQDVSLGGGGALIDLGTHCFDLLEWIMGSKVVEVCAFQNQMVHKYITNIEDASTVVVKFNNGAHGIVDNYFSIPDAASRNRLEVYGTNGAIFAEGTIGQDPTGKMLSILQTQGSYQPIQVRGMTSSQQEYQLKGEGIYGQMIETFSQSILNNQEPPVTIKDGKHSVGLINAIYQSAQERRVVVVME